MVRQAQPWVVEVPPVDQGNLGLIDGDSPAAMRYIETLRRSRTPDTARNNLIRR